LVGKPDRKRQLGQPRHSYADDIKMDLQELRWGIVLIDLAQVCQAVMKTSGLIKCWEFLEWLRDC
jgi:hypothetical protein